jgi:hypothetical protein
MNDKAPEREQIKIKIYEDMAKGPVLMYSYWNVHNQHTMNAYETCD